MRHTFTWKYTETFTLIRIQTLHATLTWTHHTTHTNEHCIRWWQITNEKQQKALTPLSSIHVYYPQLTTIVCTLFRYNTTFKPSNRGNLMWFLINLTFTNTFWQDIFCCHSQGRRRRSCNITIHMCINILINTYWWLFTIEEKLKVANTYSISGYLHP